ncbi:MAG: SDR family oxidoreductase [Bacteroidetes bacterium]|nr:SDR family oxidoreductase [Bacteroidota bacterium]
MHSSPRIVAITGAGSGIGLLLAARFLTGGDTVVGLDIDMDALDRARTALGPSFHGFQLDLADPEAIRRVFTHVEQAVGGVDILINNAGIVAGKWLLDHTDQDVRRTFAINVEAHFHTVRAVLPGMIERGFGHIVSVASAGGLAATARLSAYSASKFAAVGFDEALRIEMKRLGHPIRTTLVAPFYIHTGMFDGVKTRFPWLLPILDPEKVATRIHRAVQNGKRRLIMPWFVYAGFPLRLLPVDLYDRLTDFFGVSRSMDDFRGRP